MKTNRPLKLSLDKSRGFHPAVERKVTLAISNVRTDRDGYVKPGKDWRDIFARFLRRTLPKDWWVYKGGHHIAVHASAPRGNYISCGVQKFDPEAGECLFRIVEVAS